MLVINPLICEEVWLPSWTREVVLYNKDSVLVSEDEKLPGSCKGQSDPGPPSNTGSSTADLVKWNPPQKKFTSAFWISLINASGGSTTVEWCQSTEVAKLLTTKILPMQDNCGWTQLHRDNRALIFSANFSFGIRLFPETHPSISSHPCYTVAPPVKWAPYTLSTEDLHIWSSWRLQKMLSRIIPFLYERVDIIFSGYKNCNIFRIHWQSQCASCSFCKVRPRESLSEVV